MMNSAFLICFLGVFFFMLVRIKVTGKVMDLNFVFKETKRPN